MCAALSIFTASRHWELSPCLPEVISFWLLFSSFQRSSCSGWSRPCGCGLHIFLLLLIL